MARCLSAKACSSTYKRGCMFTVPIASQWHLLQPVVYRHLGRQWVRSFFEKGELQLKSFAAFREHDDESRLDAYEGKGHFEYQDEGVYTFARGEVANNAYILCGSTSNHDDIAAHFSTDAYIIIEQTMAFAAAVSRHIPGFVHGSEGPCLYMQGSTLQRMPWAADARAAANSGEISRDQLRYGIETRLGPYLPYLKHSQFRNQLEYRMVWYAECESERSVTIRVPEARKFCTADPATIAAMRPNDG